MKQYGPDDAEAELRAAIDRDDLAEILRLESVIDVKPASVSLHAAALWYAQQGLRTFPLQPGRKAPMGKCDDCGQSDCPGPEACGHDLCHGFKDATKDPARITRWWESTPRANIGIATGWVFDVIDVDGPVGVQTWIDMKDDLPPTLGRVSTPRPGGNHLYVAAAAGRGNKTQLFPDVDFRGAGGYAVCPPSVIAPGGKDYPGTYRWIVPLDMSRAPQERVA